MRWPFEAASALGALVIAGCTIYYFVAVFLWPEHAAMQEDEERDRRRTLLGKWPYYGYLIAAFVGIAFVSIKAWQPLYIGFRKAG